MSTMQIASRWSGLALALALTTGSAGAQVSLDGTTPSTLSVDGSTTKVDGGAISGRNQFHSFERFSVGAGATVDFQNSSGQRVSNVISRVTGSDPSSIDGALRVSVPDANFYLVNPNGVVIGESAVVDVPGAANFSDADELRFSNGEVFSATNPNASTFSSADPTSFGFLGSAPQLFATSDAPQTSTITLDSEPGRTTGSILTVSGAGAGVETRVSGGTRPDAVGGAPGPNLFHSFEEFSVGANDRVVFESQPDLTRIISRVVGGEVSEIAGEITVDDTAVEVFLFNPAGVTFYEGAQFDAPALAFVSTAPLVTFADGSVLFTDTSIADPSLAPDLFSAAPIAFSTFNLEIGSAADVNFVGDTAVSAPLSTGPFVIQANDVTVSSGFELAASGDLAVFEVGAVGDGFVNVGLDNAPLPEFGGGGALTGTITVTDAEIAANSPTGAAIVSFVGGELILSDATVSAQGLQTALFLDEGFSRVAIDGSTLSSIGDGVALIAVDADAVEIIGATGRNTLLAATTTVGSLARIDIVGDQVAIENTDVFVLTEGANLETGLFVLAIEDLVVRDANIIAANDDNATLAFVQLLANDSVTLSNLGVSAVSNSLLADAQGFFVEIAADDVALRDTVIDASTFGAAGAGVIVVDGFQSTEIVDSELRADSFGSGSAGLVAIEDGSDEGRTDPTTMRIENSTLSASADATGADAGGVRVVADEKIRIRSSELLVESVGGAAGTIFISDADTFGTTGAGKILLRRSSLSAAARGATGDAGQIFLSAEELDARRVVIDTRAEGAGGGGDVTLIAAQRGRVRQTNVNTSSTAGASSGAVNFQSTFEPSVEAPFFVVLPDSQFTVRDTTISSLAPQGSAGTVAIGSDLIKIDNSNLNIAGGGVSTQGALAVGSIGDTVFQNGTVVEIFDAVNLFGGGISIISSQTGDVVVAGRGTRLSANADALSVASGQFLLSALSGEVRIEDGARVETNANGVDSVAAFIVVTADRFTMDADARLTATATAPGSTAGVISIFAGDVFLSDGSRISTNSLEGDGGTISFNILNDGIVVVQGSEIFTSSESADASGGRITFDGIKASQVENTLDTEAFSNFISRDGVRFNALVLQESRIEALGGVSDAFLLINARVLVDDIASTIAIAGVDNIGGEDARADVSAQELSFADASEILRDLCAPQRAGQTSSLGFRGDLGTRTDAPVSVDPLGDPISLSEGPGAVALDYSCRF